MRCAHDALPPNGVATITQILAPAHTLAFSYPPTGNWSLKFPFDDAAGNYPFSVNVTGCQAREWGYWKGSNITAPPPTSPVDASACGKPTGLRLVPFGSTNIRIGVFPYYIA